MLKKLLPLGLFLVVFIFLLRGLQLNPREMPSAQIGKPLPPMMLTLWGENKKNSYFSTYQGMPLIIHFWATWCDSCQQDVLELEKLHQLKMATLLGVNYKDKPKALTAWLALNRMMFDDLILDKDGRLGLELGVVATPETFIVDKNGVIRFRIQGPITNPIIQNQILPLLKELQ